MRAKVYFEALVTSSVHRLSIYYFYHKLPVILGQQKYKCLWEYDFYKNIIGELNKCLVEIQRKPINN